MTGLAAGMPTDHLPGVLDLVEDAVRRRTNVTEDLQKEHAR